MDITIFHNPRCSKSRQTLALMQERGLQPLIREYLIDPPSAAELAELVKALGTTADEIMRTGEDDYKAARDEVQAMGDAEKLEWLSAHPKVIQRPIVVTGSKARVGRPPESVLDILPGD
jgi:arsenate reductase